MSFNFGTQDPYVKTGTVGTPSAVAGTLSNGGTVLGNAVILGNLSSGPIGTAAATIDNFSIIVIPETSSAQTLTLPSPTVTSEYKLIVVCNTGSASFTMLGQTVAAGASLMAIYNTSAWSFIA